MEPPSTARAYRARHRRLAHGCRRARRGERESGETPSGVVAESGRLLQSTRTKGQLYGDLAIIWRYEGDHRLASYYATRSLAYTNAATDCHLAHAPSTEDRTRCAQPW